jgi:hypothetical protein
MNRAPSRPEPPRDFLATIRDRWAAFLQLDRPPSRREDTGLERVLRRSFPIEAAGARLEYVSYDLARPRYALEACRIGELSHGGAFTVRLRLVRGDGTELEEPAYLGELPRMLDPGTFLRDGYEVVLPLIQRPGGVVRFPDDRLAEALSRGLADMARTVRERINLLEAEYLSPRALVDARTIYRSVDGAFDPPSSELASLRNPLDQLTHVLSVRGESADPFDVSCLPLAAVPLLEHDAPAELARAPELLRAAHAIRGAAPPWVRSGWEVPIARGSQDGPAIQDGCLALGRDTVVAWADTAGAIVNDAVVESFTSERVERLAAQISETRAGREQITRDVPGYSEEQLQHLDDDGVVTQGTEVEPGDVLVGIVRPRPLHELGSPEEALLHAIFGRMADEPVEDASLLVPPGLGGRVRAVHHLRRITHLPDERRREIKVTIELLKKEHAAAQEPTLAALVRELASFGRVTWRENGTPVTLELLRRYDARATRELLDPTRLVFEGDELALHRALLPHLDRLEDAENAHHNALNRLQRGDELGMGVLERVIVELAVPRPLQVGDRLATRHGDEHVVVAIGPKAAMPALPDGTAVEVVLPRPSRAHRGPLLEARLGAASRRRGASIVAPPQGTSLAEIEAGAGATDAGGGPVHLLKTSCAADALEVRETGPYARPSEQPVRAPRTCSLDTARARAADELLAGSPAGQVVSPLDLVALVLRGASATIHDRFVLQSLRPERPHTYPFDRLRALLRGLALRLELESLDGSSVLTVRLASPDELRAESGGAVTNPRFVDHRTRRPAPDGLIAREIFGPEGDRPGHVDFAVPVVHPLFRAEVATLLGLSPAELDGVLAGRDFLVTRSGADLRLGERLEALVIAELKHEHGDAFAAETGPASVRAVLAGLDLQALARNQDEPERQSLARGLLASGARPEWLVLTVLGVIPAAFRPAAGDEFFDLDELYRTVVARNAYRTRDEDGDDGEDDEDEEGEEGDEDSGPPGESPEAEAQRLRELGKAVESLFRGDGSRRSLVDEVRAALDDAFTKRVDHSARAAAVVDPALPPLTCGLPRTITGGLGVEDGGWVVLVNPSRPGRDRLVALEARAVDGVAVTVPPGTWPQAREVIVHRPVSDAALAEIERLRPTAPLRRASRDDEPAPRTLPELAEAARVARVAATRRGPAVERLAFQLFDLALDEAEPRRGLEAAQRLVEWASSLDVPSIEALRESLDPARPGGTPPPAEGEVRVALDHLVAATARARGRAGPATLLSGALHGRGFESLVAAVFSGRRFPVGGLREAVLLGSRSG